MGISTKVILDSSPTASSVAAVGAVKRRRLDSLRGHARRWLPAHLRTAFRAADTAAHQRLYRPPHFSAWLCDAAGTDGSAGTLSDRRPYLSALLGWLKRAQDAAAGAGVPGYYAFAEGWSAAYPETTGYIIVTCLEAAARLDDPELAARARQLSDWELSVQMPEGAWQSGLATTTPVPAVFNTGQVIQGLLAAYRAFGQTRYLEAAARGGHWLVRNQDADGAWRRHTYRSFPNSYSTRVAWPLLDLATVTSERRLRQSAVDYLQWATRCQDESGWLDRCTLEPGEPALTHTLGYAMEGFLESGVLLGEERWVRVAEKTAEALMRRYEVRGHLAGAYDRGWRGDHSYACMTGCAQVALVWCRLYQLRGDSRYLNAALKLNDFVTSHIDLSSRWLEFRGAVKGSQPVWGHYMTFRLPSWAVKFATDALLREEQALAEVEARR